MLFSIRSYGRWPHAYVSVFITLLVLSSAPAYAEWVEVGGPDDGTYTHYADPTTIRRNGTLVKMWLLEDYKTIQTVDGKSFLSDKVQREYDCAEEQQRLLAFYWFSGQMGSGAVVYSNTDPSKWAPVMPGSVGQALWKTACGKK